MTPVVKSLERTSSLQPKFLSRFKRKTAGYVPVAWTESQGNLRKLMTEFIAEFGRDNLLDIAHPATGHIFGFVVTTSADGRMDRLLSLPQRSIR